MKLDPQQTADALSYPLLAQEIERLLGDSSAVVPPRLVHRLSDQSSLFIMPASDSKLAITKLITWVADNPSRGLPAIQGEVMVFDVRDGRLLCSLDGPTVTAHRTAAVSLLAAQKLAPNPAGKLLLVGAGVQARAHLHAFVNGLGVREVVVSSRTRASAQALVDEAHSMGLQAWVADNPNHALADCSLVVSATSAQEVSLYLKPREDAFVCAIGAFTPAMVEWAPDVCAYMAQHGRLFVDTRDADHEAGDLLQAGLDVTTFPTLQALVRGEFSGVYEKNKPVFFKSGGWAGWDLAAARCVVNSLDLG